MREVRWKRGFLVVLLALVVFWVYRTNTAAPERNPICRHIQHKQDMASCNADVVWQALAKQRADKEVLPSRHITLFAGGDPIERARQLWNTGFVPPGRDVAPWPFALPVNWNADPFEDRNWRFHLHAWRMMDPMLLAWERTGENEYLQDAMRIMIDWHDYHFVSHRGSDFQWYDMAVGLRAAKLAYVLDRVMREEVASDLLSRQALVQLAYAHAESLKDPAQLSRGNHGFFQLHGLMALCSILPDVATCYGYEEYVIQKLRELLQRQFSNEGVHLEGAPEYHFFALRTVKRMLETGWYDQFAFIRQLLSKVEQNQVWMVHPDGVMVTIGDSEPNQPNLSFPTGNHECANATNSREGCHLLRTFHKTGYAIVRSDWAVPAKHASMLFFMASFHDPAHKLPDDLSIEWFDRGGRILTNAGKYSYNSDEWRRYVGSTRAHNTVEIDRSSFSTRLTDAYGSALQEVQRRADTFLLRGSVFHKHLAATHNRTLLYAPGRWLAVIDSMVANHPRQYTQWFHFTSDIEVSSNNGLYVATRSDGLKVYIEHLSSANESLLVRGQKEPSIQGWATQTYGQMEPRYALGFTRQSDKAIITTLFGFSTQDLAAARQAVHELSAQANWPGNSAD